MRKFKNIRQIGYKDCGPTCLKMIANWYKIDFDQNNIVNTFNIKEKGISIFDLAEGAESIGFNTICVKIDLKKLKKITNLGPCIIHWYNRHFVVLYKIRKSFILQSEMYYLSDPAVGNRKLQINKFIKGWKGNNEKGYVLFLEPRYP